MTEAQFPLAELAQIGPYFALRDGGCAGDDAGFEPVTGLIADTPQAAARLGQLIDEVSARLDTTQRWIGASILFQGWPVAGHPRRPAICPHNLLRLHQAG